MTGFDRPVMCHKTLLFQLGSQPAGNIPGCGGTLPRGLAALKVYLLLTRIVINSQILNRVEPSLIFNPLDF